MQQGINRPVWFGFILLLLASCGPAPPELGMTPSPVATATRVLSGTIEVWADRSTLVIANDTYGDIFIPAHADDPHAARTFRFYKKTPQGWARLRPFTGGVLATWGGNAPGIPVPAGSKETTRIAHTLGVYWPFWMGESEGVYLVQIRYQLSGKVPSPELVHYSNPFTIGHVDETIGGDEVSVNLGQDSPFSFSIQNNSKQTLWFPGACPHLPGTSYCGWGEYGDEEYNDDGYLILQRQTDSGSWEMIRAGSSAWAWTEPLQVLPGQEAAVDAQQWFHPGMNGLEPGIYRWDVAFYLEKDQSGEWYCLDEVRHVFSEPFFYRP